MAGEVDRDAVLRACAALRALQGRAPGQCSEIDRDAVLRACAILRALRRRVPGQCVVCGRGWQASYPSRRYCSATCRTRARRQRQRAD